MPPDSLGNRIKERRAEIGLSLRELADKTDLTASFISQVERNQTKPSIDSLRRIAEALGVSILFFLADHALPRARSAKRDSSLKYSPVVRADARSKLILPISGVTYELLSSDLARQMEAFAGRLSPRTGNVARRLRAPTEEFIYILSGALRVGLDEDEHILCAGDSIYFDGTTLQKLECASADEDAVWISVITPPVF
jgi:transcriptional regulator with XRE-family HTH domain